MLHYAILPLLLSVRVAHDLTTMVPLLLYEPQFCDIHANFRGMIQTCLPVTCGVSLLGDQIWKRIPLEPGYSWFVAKTYSTTSGFCVTNSINAGVNVRIMFSSFSSSCTGTPLRCVMA